MTAKALAALTPLTDVPTTAIHLSTTLLQALVVNRKIRTGGSGSGGGSAGTVIDDDRATTTGTASGDDITNSSTVVTGHNEMHGLLTLIAEPLATLNRRLVGLKLLDNHVFYTQRKTEISDGLLPILAALLSELSAVSCPPIHYVFIRILRTVVSLLTEGGGSAGGSGVGSVGGGGEGEVAVALLLGECRVSLQPILQSLDTTVVKGVSEGASEGVTKGMPEGVLMGALPPYAPTVYRESLCDLVYYSLLAATSTETPSDTSTTTTTTTTTTNPAASNPSPTSDHTSNASSPFSPYPINTSLWSLLHHPMSELREGMLLGCLRALSSEISVIGGVDDVTYTSVAHLLCEREEVMSMLLSRLNVETEPPIRILTLHLLCDLTRRRPLREMKFSRIQSASPHQPSLQPTHQTNTYDLFTSTATWQLLMSLATASTQGLGKGLGVSSKHLNEPLANNDASVRALEVMGWIIGGGRRGVSKSTSSGETSRAKGWSQHVLVVALALILQTLTCNCNPYLNLTLNSSNLTCTFSPNYSIIISQSSSSFHTPRDFHLLDWLRLVEEGAHEERGPEAREASARSLASSGKQTRAS